MNSFEELQTQVLSLPPEERGRLAVAVLDSLEGEPVDEGVAEAWASEVLARSAAYSRGELKAVEWRAALQEIEADLNETSQP
jgi:putative addiction module component (TIGR02574 family)